MNKNILGAITVVALSITVSAGYYFGFNWDKANANPDYICTKSVTNSPCVVHTWGEWNTEWRRIWTWTKTTQVRYYATRTWCESWYTATRWGWYTSWASWRKTADAVSDSTTCTLVQEDKIAPVWEITD